MLVIVLILYLSTITIATNEMDELLTLNPVIGIFTQPSKFSEYPSENFTYIASSYVKLIESGGAKVIPIPYEEDYDVLDEIFNNINGILLPGGSTFLDGPSQFSQKVGYLVKKAVEVNQNGGWFPILGICLGHELIHYILSDFIEDFKINIYGQSGVTKSLSNSNRYENVYSLLNDNEYQSATQEQILYYNHIYAISESLYQKVPILQNILKITSSDKDINGTQYITSTMGIQYPIYTFQYHPEKNPFEWKIHVNRSLNAIKFTRVHSLFFVEQCRKNKNNFTLNDRLIYHFNPIICSGSTYTQAYIFNRVKEPNIIEQNELKQVQYE